MAFKNTYFIYRAKNDKTGITDIVARVRRNGVYVLGSDVTPLALTEIDNGRYQLVLSPAQITTAGGVGFYDVLIDSQTAGDSAPAIAGKYIHEFDTDDLQSQIDGVETKIDVIDGNVDSIKLTVEDTNSEVKDPVTGLPNIKALIDALQSSVTNISNVTRFAAPVPKPLYKLDSGAKRYKLPFNMYDTSGNMEDPDSNQIQVEVSDESGNSRDSYLVGFTAQPYYLTRNATGDYQYEIDIPDTADDEQLVFKFTMVENGITLTKTVVSEVRPATEDNTGLALEATSQSILTQTTDIQSKVNDATFGLSALKALIDTIDSVVDANNAELVNGVYGLAALKAILDTKSSQASVDAVQTDITNNILGAGFDNSTDTLAQISARIFSGGEAV